MTPYPAYKPTDLPWLPKIPEHWEILRCKHIFTPVDQRSCKGEENLLSVSAKFGVIERKNANVTMFQAETYEGYKLCWPDDLVINSLWAWAFGLGFSNYHGIVSTAYSVFRLQDKIRYLPRFYNYFLRSQNFQWELRVRSKGLWKSRYQLSDDAFLTAPVVSVPISEQAQIVRYLDSMTAKINKLIRAKKKQIALLEEQKQAIINQAVTKGLDPNAEMKDSGIRHIGFIPRHWKIIKNKHLFFENTALSTDGSEELLSVSLHYGVKKYSEITEEENTATLLPAESLAGYKIVRENDLVMNIMRARNGSFGFSKYHGIVSAAYCVYTLKQHCNPFFLHYILKTPMVIKNFEENSYGIAEHRKRLYPDSFLSLFTILPPLEEQNLIVNWIEEKVKIFDVGIQKYQMEIALVSEYKNSMIASIVSGQVDIRNIPVDDFNPADLVSEDADDAEEEPTAKENEE